MASLELLNCHPGIDRSNFLHPCLLRLQGKCGVSLTEDVETWDVHPARPACYFGAERRCGLGLQDGDGLLSNFGRTVAKEHLVRSTDSKSCALEDTNQSASLDSWNLCTLSLHSAITMAAPSSRGSSRPLERSRQPRRRADSQNQSWVS